MTGKDFYEEIVIAGFGGQGIMLAGKLLAHDTIVISYYILIVIVNYNNVILKHYCNNKGGDG